jgi:hypothetical protein
MSIDRLNELLTAMPFEPFDLIMANGERLHVPHQDFLWVIPGKRSVGVAVREGVVRLVNWQLVAGLERKTAA